MDESFEDEIRTILKEDEELLSFALSEKKKSAYVIILKDEDNYITFRISDHPTNAFFSNRTFNSGIPLVELLEEIRDYMDSSDWYIFQYEDYFTLKILKLLTYKNLKIYIDNTMGIFDQSKMGLLFYQIRYFGRNHKEMNTVSPSFQKYLRRLFASGLINGYGLDNGEILVYATNIGKVICEYKDEEYKDRFEEDLENVSLRYIEIPIETD